MNDMDITDVYETDEINEHVDTATTPAHLVILIEEQRIEEALDILDDI